MKSIFRLAHLLAELHESHSGGPVAVVPVLVDNLKATLPILRALCATYNGCLLEEADPALQEAVPSTRDSFRLGIMKAALANPTDPKTRKVLVEKVGADLVDAHFEGSAPGAPMSDGERTFCSVVRAFLHRSLDDRELGIVAYSHAELDWLLSRTLWDLPAKFLRAPVTSSLRTLIVVVEAGVISVGVHCRSDTGFRYAVSRSRLIQRNGPDDLRNQVRWIKHGSQPVVFFLGAGFSASSNLPMGNSLRDDAIRGLIGSRGGDDDTPSEELARRFRNWMSDRVRLSEKDLSVPAEDYIRNLTLEQVIRAEKLYRNNFPTLRQFRDLHDKIIKPGSSVTDLAEVLRLMVGRALVVEVNFDCLVERFCLTPHRVFYTDRDFGKAASHVRPYLAGKTAEVPTLKVHGSIEDFESCVASEDQTERGIGGRKLNALRAVVGRGCQWIYVGASMRDQDLVPLLQSDETLKRIDERWVTPYLDASVEEFGMKRLPEWRASDSPEKTVEQRTISVTADDFFRTLRRELTSP